MLNCKLIASSDENNNAVLVAPKWQYLYANQKADRGCRGM